MTLPLPKLDDRTFQQLVNEAQRQIVQTCPGWTDLTPSDPGMVLVDVFAHLTELMLFRLNQLPPKAYIAFLRLLGVTMQAPAAAVASLRFSRSRDTGQRIEIPRGTHVTVSRSGVGDKNLPVFVTAQPTAIEPGATQVDVVAYHCEQVDAELAGTGTGMPGQTVTARRPPLVASRAGGDLDLVVGVEAAPDELDEQARARAREYGGKAFRVWREVENFSNVGADRFVYVVDRLTGTLTFAPAAYMTGESGSLGDMPSTLGEIPPKDREIRLWYLRGGGPEGNVAANTLTVLKDPIPGVQVTNPEAATGGRAQETLENALTRGPLEFHSLQRAVTAMDFELLAKSSYSPAIARAKAFTRAALWRHALPGTVEVVIVPYTPQQEGGETPTAPNLMRALNAQEVVFEDVRDQIQASLDERRPLGTTVMVNWARYKKVRVQARVVVRREEDQAAVKARLLDRLNQTINPLPTKINPTGWPFGETLHVSNVYDIALKEPGVRWIDNVELQVDEVPDNACTALTADAFQPNTWYVGSGPILFRSGNNGDGWEPVGRYPDEQISTVRVHPGRPGLLAVSTLLPDNRGSSLYLSRDCGESWDSTTFPTAFRVYDIAWTLRDNLPILFLATDVGLYQITFQADGSPGPDSSLVQLLVDQADHNKGFYAVVATTDVRGQMSVAVAARNTDGVWLSSEGGRLNTFRRIGLSGQDVRVLAVQYSGPTSYLWAGTAAPSPEAPGTGCFRWELRGSQDPPEGWVPFSKGWTGGSCRAIAFMQDMRVLAGSYRSGVMRMNANTTTNAWEAPDINSGLPLRGEQDRLFKPITGVAADPAGRTLLASVDTGVYRSIDVGVRYQHISKKAFGDKVTLPDTWLFISGDHTLDVVSEDEAK